MGRKIEKCGQEGREARLTVIERLKGRGYSGDGFYGARAHIEDCRHCPRTINRLLRREREEGIPTAFSGSVQRFLELAASAPLVSAPRPRWY